MRRVAAVLLLLGASLHTLAAADLAHKIHELLESTPAARSAYWGILVVEQASGKVLFELNPDHFFVPASNTKLFTTALALARLGPAYRFRTTVRMEKTGSIRLVGGGDPNLSNRAIPYRTGAASGNPLQAIEDLADQVVAHGIEQIPGDVIGDDTAYVWQPPPDGWAADDGMWDYGAPTSALTVNDNMFTLAAEAGAHDGDPVTLTLSPDVEYYEIDNRLRTDSRAEKRFSVERLPGSNQLRVWGSLPPGRTARETLGIDDPAMYAAQAFYDALTRRGVRIGGRPVARHLYPNQISDRKGGAAGGTEDSKEVAVRISAPLVEDLRITDKVSHNLHAEMLLRAVGRARRKIGSRQAGLDELRAFLAEVGIDEDAYRFEDGAGLSRLNLVEPRVVVDLLRYMYATPHWMSLLPVGGEDGTLGSRFSDPPAFRRIHAKTGTLSHVSALSGYAERRSGGTRTFSILVNNYNTAGSSDIRAVMDQICTLIVE